MVAPSRLGLVLATGPLAEGLKIVRQTESSMDVHWKPVYGERSTIRDHYNQIVVELQERNAPHRLLHLTLRAYDEGAAFCYTLPKQPDMERVTISREMTEFRFPADFSAWATYTAQGLYANVPISQIKAGCERPLVVRLAEDRYAAVAEARLRGLREDEARRSLAGVPHSLTAELGSEVSSVAAAEDAVARDHGRRQSRAAPGEQRHHPQPQRSVRHRGHLLDQAGQGDPRGDADDRRRQGLRRFRRQARPPIRRVRRRLVRPGE